MFPAFRVITLDLPRARINANTIAMAMKWGSLVAGILLLAVSALTVFTGIGAIWTFFNAGYKSQREMEILGLAIQLIGAGSILMLLAVLVTTVALFMRPRVW